MLDRLDEHLGPGTAAGQQPPAGRQVSGDRSCDLGRHRHPEAVDALPPPVGLGDVLYRAARLTRDAGAVERSLETGSAKPIERRLIRKKALGRGFGRAMTKGGL